MQLRTGPPAGNHHRVRYRSWSDAAANDRSSSLLLYRYISFDNERLQNIARYLQRPLAAFQGLPESVVLDLDADRPIVADLLQGRHEARPVNVSIAWDARRVPLLWKSEPADFGQLLSVDAHVFGVDVN